MFLHNTNKLAICVSQAHCHMTTHACADARGVLFYVVAISQFFICQARLSIYQASTLAGHFCFIFSANAIFANAEILEHY